MFLDPYDLRRALRDGTSIVAGGSVKLSAGTTSSARSDFTFSNSPTVTFGLNGVGVITASVAPGGGGLTNINVSAGSTSSNVSAVTFNNANGVTFGYDGTNVTASVFTNYQSTGAYLTTAQPPGAYLTTGMASNQGSNFVQATAVFHGTNATGTIASNGISVSVAAPAAANINISAGTTSSNVAAVTFSNGSGVSFGFDGSNITATVATNYQSLGAYLTTAQPPGAYLTTAMLSNASSVFAGGGFTTATTAGTDIVGTLNTSGLSMGIPAYLTAAAAGTGVGSNTSTVTTAGTNLTFAADTNGISIAYPAWLTTAGTGGGGGATLSFYENAPVFAAGSSLRLDSVLVSTIYLQPFVLPQAVSASFLRLPVRNALPSTTIGATSANSSFAYSYTHSTAIVIYTQMTGASSLSLGYYTSILASLVSQLSITAANVASQYTVIYNFTYPVSGTYSNLTVQSNHSNASYFIDGNPDSNFSNYRWFDVPFATLLSAGNYWLGFGVSRSSASNGGPNFSGAAIAGSLAANLDVLATWGNMGVATGATNQNAPGLGVFSTNSAISTTAPIALSQIVLVNSQPRLYFQLIRQA